MVHDGKYIYYLQSNEMTQDLMKIEVASNVSDIRPEVVQSGLQAYGFSITRDNKNLIYTKKNDFSNLWTFTYNESKNIFQSKKLTKGTDYYSSPVISPDGENIAYVHKGNVFKCLFMGTLLNSLHF